MRLLYVDDDRVNTLLFVETCKLDPQLDVRSAGTGVEAVALAIEWQPDVLVLDLHLPDTDGYALLAALRALPAGTKAAAFLCSADDTIAVRDAAERAGFSGCWPKPVDLMLVLRDLALIRGET